MLHIPLLRHGKPYQSLDVVRIPHYKTREPFVGISQANVGLIRRDLLHLDEVRENLAGYSSAELLQICNTAAQLFLHTELPVGEAVQTPEDYVAQVSATTGLPYVLARRNMLKIHKVMAEMPAVLRGLTRNLDLSVLDRGFGAVDGQEVSFFPRGNSLGVVLPSNSPGVHSLWIPAFALKIPLVLKPGGAEPWTPYRIIQALIRAGAPPEAFCYYPADHAGGGEILRRCERGMVFGDVGSTKIWQGDPRIEVHGPGYSKIVIGRDKIGEWEKYLDVMVASIVENSGRSCINASGVWAPEKAGEIAEALAERLAHIFPLDAEDPDAQLAPFADSSVAERISAMIDSAQEGARDVTAEKRRGGRLATLQGCTYLLPTIIHCPSAEHDLANREFLFPFASVVEIDEGAIPHALGPSLVVTAITEDRKLIDRLLRSPLVGRLNLGMIATNHIQWDQPHEGNLFDHLYARRAFQRTLEAIAS
ncbi:MAG TPA: aldehyde dehydrogenase family protein [Bryobacteraceae bacterium]|nr:aldehyde dehydrogenase family protein [Bryobacteraceae bacterium]